MVTRFIVFTVQSCVNGKTYHIFMTVHFCVNGNTYHIFMTVHFCVNGNTYHIFMTVHFCVNGNTFRIFYYGQIGCTSRCAKVLAFHAPYRWLNMGPSFHTAYRHFYTRLQLATFLPWELFKTSSGPTQLSRLRIRLFSLDIILKKSSSIKWRLK